MPVMINWKTMFQEDRLSYEDRIRKAYPNLSKSFARLADYLLDSYVEAAFMTATELGHAVDVDATTVVRFSQYLGYAGYPDLAREIRERVKSHLTVRPRVAEEDSLARVVNTALQELRTIFGQAYLLLDVDELSRLVEKIGEARHVFILADVLAQPATYTLVNVLERGGFGVSINHTGLTDLARKVYLAAENDLILAIEVAGETPYIARALQEARNRRIPTCAIVGSAAVDSARVAELVVVVQAQPASELSMMLVGAVAYALGRALRWRFPDRFSGADQAVHELSTRIQSHELS